MSDLVTRLRERCETLEEENRQYRALLVPHMTFPPEWGLSARTGAVLAAIAAGGPRGVRPERVFAALYGFSDTAPTSNILQHLVYRLRLRLRAAGAGVVVETLPAGGPGVARGWRLSPASLDRLGAACAAVGGENGKP